MEEIPEGKNCFWEMLCLGSEKSFIVSCIKMRSINLSSLNYEATVLLFFFKEEVHAIWRESVPSPWTGLGFWLVSVSRYGNLGNLNTCVSFQEEHFREGCHFIGGTECFSFSESSTDSISIYLEQPSNQV